MVNYSYCGIEHLMFSDCKILIAVFEVEVCDRKLPVQSLRKIVKHLLTIPNELTAVYLVPTRGLRSLQGETVVGY